MYLLPNKNKIYQNNGIFFFCQKILYFMMGNSKDEISRNKLAKKQEISLIFATLLPPGAEVQNKLFTVMVG